MSSRYQNNKKKKIKRWWMGYRSKIYPKIPKRDNDIYIVTQGGDRLDTLVNQFYSDSSLCGLTSTNNLHDGISSDGTILRIPVDKNKILNDFYK